MAHNMYTYVALSYYFDVDKIILFLINRVHYLTIIHYYDLKNKIVFVLFQIITIQNFCIQLIYFTIPHCNYFELFKCFFFHNNVYF